MNASILVVEDEPAIQELIRVNLEDAGFSVRAAEDAETAYEQIRAALPDLVLLDWMLPGQSGLALARSLRGDARTRELPIIMLSGKDGLFDKMRGKLAGSTEYMTKPFDSAELVQMVKRYLDAPAVRERAARRTHHQQERLRRHV